MNEKASVSKELNAKHKKVRLLLPAPHPSPSIFVDRDRALLLWLTRGLRGNPFSCAVDCRARDSGFGICGDVGSWFPFRRYADLRKWFVTLWLSWCEGRIRALLRSLLLRVMWEPRNRRLLLVTFRALHLAARRRIGSEFSYQYLSGGLINYLVYILYGNKKGRTIFWLPYILGHTSQFK